MSGRTTLCRIGPKMVVSYGCWWWSMSTLANAWRWKCTFVDFPGRAGRVAIPVCRSGQARTHSQPTNATRRCPRSRVRSESRSPLAGSSGGWNVVYRQRQPLGEWLCRVGGRQATRRTLESRVVLELGGGLLGDRPLATGLQPLPHPQCIELSGPCCVCGWLCSSSFGYASASRTQPSYLTPILSLRLVQRRRGGQ